MADEGITDCQLQDFGLFLGRQFPCGVPLLHFDSELIKSLERCSLRACAENLSAFEGDHIGAIIALAQV